MKYSLKQTKIALALGGGATKGAALFGIIEGLEKQKFQPEIISGTSIGAIIGAYYALHGEIDSLKKEILSFKDSDWLKFADISVLSGKSLIKADYYRQFLEKKFENKNFSDTKIPLIISTTNLTTGKIEYIKKGKIADAVIASSAYPGIFPFIKKDSGVYVDGGVLDNLPYNILLEKGYNKIVAVNLSNGIKTGEIKNIFNVISTSIDLMIENAFKGLEHKNPRVFMLQPKFSDKNGSSWKVGDLREKYQAGVEEFKSKERDFEKWVQE